MKAPDHSTPVLYPPIITGSERNLIRLRIWLANRVYRESGDGCTQDQVATNTHPDIPEKFWAGMSSIV